MKLDHISNGSPDAPLIRLFDFTPAEAGALHAAILELATGMVEKVSVHDLPFVESLAGCRLKLIHTTWDQAVIGRGHANDFICGLTADSWDHLAGLIEPFAADASGCQWLTSVPGEATILLSRSGHW